MTSSWLGAKTSAGTVTQKAERVTHKKINKIGFTITNYPEKYSLVKQLSATLLHTNQFVNTHVYSQTPTYFHDPIFHVDTTCSTPTTTWDLVPCKYLITGRQLVVSNIDRVNEDAGAGDNPTIILSRVSTQRCILISFVNSLTTNELCMGIRLLWWFFLSVSNLNLHLHRFFVIRTPNTTWNKIRENVNIFKKKNHLWLSGSDEPILNGVHSLFPEQSGLWYIYVYNSGLVNPCLTSCQQNRW